METKAKIHRASKLTIVKKEDKGYCVTIEYEDGYETKTLNIHNNDSIGLYMNIATLFTGMSVIDYKE